MRPHIKYALIGVALGLGAPVGAIFARYLFLQQALWSPWLREEWFRFGYFYAYMAMGTTLALALFGYFIGKRSDRLQENRQTAESTIETLNLIAIIDSLTGLYNHRYLHERMAQEIEAANRYNTPLTCIMMDLDNFKAINDAYSHPFGDLVLVTVAGIIRENVRRVDLVGRHGGEEFMVLMPHTTAQDALPIAERIREAVRSASFTQNNQEIRVTMSLGMATYPSPHLHIHDKRSLISAADEALYEAKRLGKDKTVIRQSKMHAVS